MLNWLKATLKKAKWWILTMFRKNANKCEYNRCVDLNSAQLWVRIDELLSINNMTQYSGLN